MFMSEEQFEAECVAQIERSRAAQVEELGRLGAAAVEQAALDAQLTALEARLARLDALVAEFAAPLPCLAALVDDSEVSA